MPKPNDHRYVVHSIFGPTIQGEGGMAGLSTVFVRFAGCNVWDGQPETRAGATCWFCDTEFRGGQKMTAWEVVDQIKALDRGVVTKWITLTGGEPLLQVDSEFLDVLSRAGFRASIETNGTREIIPGFTGHLSLSPKVPRDRCKISHSDTLKILYPYLPGVHADDWRNFPASNRYIQPIDTTVGGGGLEANYEAVVREVKRLGFDWRVGLQIHKHLGEE